MMKSKSEAEPRLRLETQTIEPKKHVCKTSQKCEIFCFKFLITNTYKIKNYLKYKQASGST